MIRFLTTEQEKSLRDILIYDHVYMMVHDTLRAMRPEMTDLTQVQIWLAATDFTTRLLQLTEAEELLPDEVDDLRIEAKDKNDAVLIMTTSICQLSALRKKESIADDLIRWLLPHVMHNPIYRPLLELIDGKEQRMALKGRTMDFDNYGLTHVEVKDEHNKEVERMFNNFVENLNNMTPQAAEAQLLLLNLQNLQEGHRYDKQVLEGFKKLKFKVDVHPLVKVENGDYVIEKHVDNEIGKVETGGAGILINKQDNK